MVLMAAGGGTDEGVSFALSPAVISRARRATAPRRHLLLSTKHCARGGLDYAFCASYVLFFASSLLLAPAISSPLSA